MKRTGKRQEEAADSWVSWMLDLLRGAVVSLTVTLLVLLLCSAAVSGQWLSQGAMSRGGMAACVLGAMSGGAFSLRQHRARALWLGLTSGLILFLLLLCAGVVLFDNAPAGDGMGSTLAACLCGGGISGILGRKRGKKRHRR